MRILVLGAGVVGVTAAWYLAADGHGQRVGTVKVALEGRTLAELPMVALADVPEAGFFGRAWDTIRLLFK